MNYRDAWAEISADGLYRYSLGRELSDGAYTVLFVGLNPSTADGSVDDPTIRRCVGFAQSWGMSKLLMGNLFAYRATDPRALTTVADPVGPKNRAALAWMVDTAEIVVAAWGAFRLPCDADTLAGWLWHHDKTRHLGLTRSGAPRHPLYLKRTTELQRVSRTAG